jgi:membrane protease YdiL (CAAX protease family)
VKDPVREAVTVWVSVIAGLAALELVALALPPLQQLVGALVVAAFLYVPARVLERRGQDARDAGWRFDQLPRDVAWGVGACAVVLPLFTLAFWQFPSWLGALPEAVRRLLEPYSGIAHPLHVPMTWDFAGRVAGNGAVALSEEFFYRGYMTLRFEERWGPVRSALAAAALFALGHLLQPAPWRLLVFFPALLFAWLRNRTRTVVGASIAHFLCNVWQLVLVS